MSGTQWYIRTINGGCLEGPSWVLSRKRNIRAWLITAAAPTFSVLNNYVGLPSPSEICFWAANGLDVTLTLGAITISPQRPCLTFRRRWPRACTWSYWRTGSSSSPENNSWFSILRRTWMTSLACCTGSTPSSTLVRFPRNTKMD